MSNESTNGRRFPDRDDDQVTAHALGELPENDTDSLEAASLLRPDLNKRLDDTRRVAEKLKQAIESEPSPKLEGTDGEVHSESLRTNVLAKLDSIEDAHATELNTTKLNTTEPNTTEPNTQAKLTAASKFLSHEDTIRSRRRSRTMAVGALLTLAPILLVGVIVVFLQSNIGNESMDYSMSDDSDSEYFDPLRSRTDDGDGPLTPDFENRTGIPPSPSNETPSDYEILAIQLEKEKIERAMAIEQLQIVRGDGGLTVSQGGESDQFQEFFNQQDPSDPDTRNERILSGREQYELPPENPFMRVQDLQALSTFAIDVDTASYANVRRFLNGGMLPPPAAVRIEEMINYFSYSDAPPSGNEPFSVHLDIATCPWSPAHRLLRVGLKGRIVPQENRPSTNLVFLIDVSGSMESHDKLPLLKQALTMLTDRLGENDRITIVTYAGNAGLVLPPTNGTQYDVIRNAIEGLRPGGSTHGSAGIELAYQLAQENFIDNGVNRVLLATDGDLNVGITEDDDLVRLITDKADDGVFLTVLGFGTGNLQDAKLEKIADHGNGQYAYIDSAREARKVLLEEMSASLVTIAKDVKIQIEFNPQYVREYRLIGYENRLMAASEFRNDAKDAGEIGAGHSVVALYELVPQSAPSSDSSTEDSVQLRYQNLDEGNPYNDDSTDDPREAPESLTDFADSDEWLYVRLRYKQPDADEATEIGFAVTDEGTSLNRAGEDFQFAAAVAAFGMLLRRSNHAGEATLTMIEEIASGALGEDPHGHRTEFLDLVRRAGLLTN